MQYTLILKISSENIEKCKSYRLFGKVTFTINANRDMDNFVHFKWFFALVLTFQLI